MTATGNNERLIEVDLADRSYPVRIAPGLLDAAGPAAAEVSRSRSAVIVTESTVGPLYAERLEASCQKAGLNTAVLQFPAGEKHKTLQTISNLLDGLFALDPPVDRQSVVIALGGGVAGDMAGFLAACALRGLPWLQCPTSLLADVDASTGGKTGVDHAAGKNLIGAFHQPRGVLIDVETLRTLPLAELRNGLAECVKHAVIREPELLSWIDSHAEGLQARRDDGRLNFNSDTMGELIARNVAIKARVVAEDEKESGVRAHLNFGHTIGHAIETLVGYESMRHGEAVSLGMVAENAIAAGRGLLPQREAETVREALSRLALPVCREGLDADAVWQYMLHDKKNRGGRIRMVLASGIGEVEMYDDITREELDRAIAVLGGAA